MVTLICTCGKAARSGVIKVCPSHVQLAIPPPDQLRSLPSLLGKEAGAREAAERWDKKIAKVRSRKPRSRRKRGTK